MQYTKNDWRNRNKIKTQNGTIWLTIPIKHFNFLQKINEAKIADKNWTKKHLKTLHFCYTKTSFFKSYENLLIDLYRQVQDEEYLSQINYKFIIEICKILNIRTKISWSSEYCLIDGKTERLVDLCQQSGATEYISGPAAKDYIKPDLFEKANIKLIWMDYSGYPEYNQLYKGFEHKVSILDLIFNTGPDSRGFMKF